MLRLTPTEEKRLRDSAPVLDNRDRDIQETLDSELLALMHSSDVDNIGHDQIRDARYVLRIREQAVREGLEHTDEIIKKVAVVQRRIIDRHLNARRERFGWDQTSPLEDASELVREDRDTFLIIKYMDEAPHIRATLASLLTQVDVDLGRVVIVAVNNNSTDGSEKIVADTVREINSMARVISINQSIPGGGSAARFGTDRVLATIRRMCEIDNDWTRLQRCRVAVTDGDTVYHHHVLRSLAQTFQQQPLVDGVMPFLVYKLTSALRFFNDDPTVDVRALGQIADGQSVVYSSVSLSTIEAQNHFPRCARTCVGDHMELVDKNGWVRRVPLTSMAPDGRRFGVLVDQNGARAFVVEDGTLALEQAPVSGYDAALLALENKAIGKDEKWKWHTLIGHDLFLLELFQRGGIPTSLIAPDTSDALKMFRAWALAIGGQHQLSRPGLKIVTGTDYQSGRVLQAVGCLTVLGEPNAWSETEVDRLAKMIRNFANKQSVFYGQTRSRGLERASGLYLHMTRIQDQVEREVANYSDNFYKQIAFPERVVFPLRWLLQNAICCFSVSDRQVRSIIESTLLEPMLGEEVVMELRESVLSDGPMMLLHAKPFELRRDAAEEIAEQIILENYGAIMKCYARTLTNFLSRHSVKPADYAWLFEGIDEGRNALAEARPDTDPADVWNSGEFQIDDARGQVVGMVAS